MVSIFVINSEGKSLPFSIKKIYQSCRRSGASKALAKKISEKVAEKAYSGMKTSEISILVKEFLSRKSPKTSIKFSLKEAMRKLGPSGFDFEKYVGQIFSKKGFEIKLNQIVSGACISSYEIDFVAKREELIRIGECKYHYLPGAKVDLKVSLYNYARFLDISNGQYFNNQDLKATLVTNAKFTNKAIKYSKCMNVELFGWRYPPKKGLQSLIEKSNLYPITILPSFNGYLKQVFAQRGKMLALDLLETSAQVLAKELKLPLNKIEKLVEEAEILLE